MTTTLMHNHFSKHPLQRSKPPMDDLPATSFRSVKRRRIFRQRDPSDSPLLGESASPDPQLVDADRGPSPSVNTVRQRPARRRLGGIEFTSTQPSYNVDRDANAATQRLGSTENQHDVGHRFAPQTGQIADVDKHM